MGYKTILFSILVFFNVASVSTAFAESPVITNMIFFGDSLSDIGNNTWILMDGKNIGAPITNPNDQNQQSLWPNYLAEAKLGKPVYPSSSNGLNPLNDNISYAYASAETSNEYLNTNWPRNTDVPPFVNTANCLQVGAGVIKNEAGEITSTCVPGLLRQVNTYLDNVQNKPNSSTVFFIWSGANDLQNYLSSYIKNNGHIPSGAELLSLEQKVAGNINQAKNKLIDAGVQANMIYIINLPDLSKVPAIQVGDNSWEFYIKKILLTIPTTLSDVSLNLNHELQFQAVEEKYRLPSSHYVDAANFFNDMIQDPKKYALNNTTESCVLKNAIPACSGFLFYNDKHPTTWANKLFSENVLTLLNQSSLV